MDKEKWEVSQCLPTPSLSNTKGKKFIMTSFLVLNWLEGMVFVAYYFTPVVLNTDSTLKIFAWAPF